MIPELAPWQGRVVSAAQAVADVRPGSRVFIGSACATPRTLLAALEAQEPTGVELSHFLTDGAAGADPDLFRHRAWYIGRDMRDLAAAGKLDYVPVSLVSIPRLLAAGRIDFDVAFVQVAPPDEAGLCSLGVSVDVTRSCALAAKRIVAEVNPRMPRTGPDSSIPFDRIDALVEVDQPIIEYVHPEAGEVAERVARYIARLIDDGSTLQVGLGRVPNHMLRFLEERRGLRIHSDVITEPILDLVDRGVATGRMVGSLAMGTRRLYDFLDNNPDLVLEPIEQVADPERLAQLPRLASVTQAFAIDLSGRTQPSAQIALERARLQIGLARAHTPWVAVLPHWGREHVSLPSPLQSRSVGPSASLVQARRRVPSAEVTSKNRRDRPEESLGALPSGPATVSVAVRAMSEVCRIAPAWWRTGGRDHPAES